MFIKNYIILFCLTFAFVFCSCREKNKGDIVSIEIDTSYLNIRYSKNIFTIPSPHQTALIISENNLKYNNQLSNDPNSYNQYTSQLSMALNIGIYSTDLAYAVIYQKEQQSIDFLSAIKKLSQNLDIDDGLADDLFEKIENNFSENDSIIKLLARSYSDLDDYLKDNNRQLTSFLIITGGWIESLYIALEYAKANSSERIYEHLSSQKKTADRIIQILKPYYNSDPRLTKLVENMVEIAYEFDCIDHNYSYQQSEIDTINKICTIRSSTEINDYGYNFDHLHEIVSNIRSEIIKSIE